MIQFEILKLLADKTDEEQMTIIQTINAFVNRHAALIQSRHSAQFVEVVND